MPNVDDPHQLIDLAVAAEESGWDGFFLWDHLQLMSNRPVVHDPWVLLGAFAVRTSRVTLGTLVTPVPRRRPWKLAKEVATLDHLSGGRVVLGVGLGVPVDLEYAAFGEPTRTRTHAAMLDEALPLLDAFLRGDPVDHDGEHYHVHAHLNPPALQRPRPPIWVAATLPNPGPIARAQRWDGIFPLGALTPSGVADLIAGLDVGADYDVVTSWSPGASVPDLAAAGATWVIDGMRSPEEPYADILGRVRDGPPR